MEKYELGLNKKSFSLFYNNGEIWCEHLDSMYDKRELVVDKFNEDLLTIARPSTSSFIAINVDETEIDKELIEYILVSINSLNKPISKVAVVGLSSKLKSHAKKLKLKFVLGCLDDYEKAKEWLV